MIVLRTVFAILLAIGLGILPANAALVFSATGTIDNSSGWFLQPDGTARISFDYVPATWSRIQAAGSIPNTFAGYSVLRPLPSPQTYRIVFTTPGTAISAGYSVGTAFWFENYGVVSGTPYSPLGGGDDVVGSNSSPCPPCDSKALIQGNKISWQVTDGVNYSVEDDSDGFGYALFTWTGDILMTGVLPGSVWERPFTEQIFISSAVPEPETWALFILGFGAVGGAVRANRRSRRT